MFMDVGKVFSYMHMSFLYFVGFPKRGPRPHFLYLVCTCVNNIIKRCCCCCFLMFFDAPQKKKIFILLGEKNID